MLGRIFEALYIKVFVNIIVSRSSCDIVIELYSNKSVTEKIDKSFATTSVEKEMKEFISLHTKDTPYHYISILDTSSSQGAIPTCDKHRKSYYYDSSDSEYKCHDEKWSFYTSKTDLYEIEKKYKEPGLDFVFSPFSVLSNFFKDKIDSYIAMYILIEDGYISMSIFKDSELLYAEHLNIKDSVEHDTDEELLSSGMDDEMDFLGDDSIDLEDIDVDIDDDIMDDLDDLEAFGDIEDLDALEDIDEFSDHKDIEEEFSEIEDESFDEEEEEEDDTFNEDYQRFSLIQNSLGKYYNDEGEFIENVYIADSIGVSKDLKKYLEEEMFLNVYIRHIDLASQLSDLARMELK